MKYTAAVVATIAVAQAAPVDQVCKVVTSVVYGQPTWVPNNAAPTWSAVPEKTPEAKKTTTAAAESTWSVWSSVKTPEASSKTTSAWSEWATTTVKTPEASKKTTTTEEHTWTAWTSVKTPEASSKTTSAWSEWATTTTTKKTPEASSKTTSSWSEWAAPASSTSTTTKKEEHHTTTAAPTTTAAATTTKATTTTTTTTPALPEPTCGAGKSTTTVSDGKCDYTLYCNQASDQAVIGKMIAAGTLKFWEATPGVQHNDVAECEALCSADSECTSVIYTDDAKANSNDFKRCWLTNNLPLPSSDGYGQLSFKVAGSCKA